MPAALGAAVVARPDEGPSPALIPAGSVVSIGLAVALGAAIAVAARTAATVLMRVVFVSIGSPLVDDSVPTAVWPQSSADIGTVAHAA